MAPDPDMAKKKTWAPHLCAGSENPSVRRKSVYSLLMSLAVIFSALIVMRGTCCAKQVDYQELQEDPIETAYRKLTSTGGIDWDAEEIISGGAPDFIKDMMWPLKACKIGGYFSRTSGKGRRRHLGLDLLAPGGTPIYAALDGIVEVVSNGGRGFRGFGNVIIINHDGKLWSLYSHCATMSVRIGQRVRKGQQVATVGHTGRATTNHLHFEIRNAKGAALDPIKYLPAAGAYTAINK